MKIDKKVEPAVREAFAASVAEEPERFETAFEVIADRGDDFARRALSLAIAIDASALFNLHEGLWPDEEQARKLAHDFMESETWARVPEEDAATFLTALSDPASLPTALPLGDLAWTSYVMGGWLLAAFLPEGRDWTDFLDDILDKLEDAPELN